MKDYITNKWLAFVRFYNTPVVYTKGDQLEILIIICTVAYCLGRGL